MLHGWLGNFVAPVVGVGELAAKIVEMVDKGEGGLVALPVYARWIAWMGVLPVAVQSWVREWSGIDSAFARSSRQNVRVKTANSEKKGVKGEG